MSQLMIVLDRLCGKLYGFMVGACVGTCIMFFNVRLNDHRWLFGSWDPRALGNLKSPLFVYDVDEQPRRCAVCGQGVSKSVRCSLTGGKTEVWLCVPHFLVVVGSRKADLPLTENINEAAKPVDSSVTPHMESGEAQKP